MSRRLVFEEVVCRLIKHKGHCSSCHQDADEYGYFMLLIDLGRNREAEVCCEVHSAYEEWLKNKKKEAAHEKV